MKNITRLFSYNNYLGFTLVEVLVVLILLGLIFSTVTFLFWSTVNSSINIVKNSERLKQKALLFWQLQKAFYGAKNFYLEGGKKLFLITSGGQYYKGIVKAVFIYKNSTLYYWEFPYPYGNLTDYNASELQPLYHFSSVSFIALNEELKGFENYYQMPYLLKVEIDNQTLIFKKYFDE
jgi:prepilin-type N-terminal cleavage/methylation domain-containing protein